MACLASSVVVLTVATVSCGLISHPSQVPYEWPPATAPASPGGLTVRFFGVTTIRIDDGATAIMTDGFFSRPGLLRLLFDELGPDDDRIADALKKGDVKSLAAVLVAHAHHDHAMDSAEVARRTGAVVVGSRSTANLGKPKRMEIVEHGAVLSYGGFTVQVFESPHTPSPLFRGSITEPVDLPARLSAYKDGGNFSFLVRHERGTILIHPGTNCLPGQFQNVKADVVFLGIARLGRLDKKFAEDYWREVVQATGARLVIPIHWDDFMVSLEEPLRPMPIWMDDFDASLRRLRELAGNDVRVLFMKPFDPYELPRRQRAGKTP